MTKQRRKPSVVVVLGLAVTGFLLLSAESCDTAEQDRAKREADGFQDASQVVVWRNADQVPNLVTFCADNLAWATTLSSDGLKNPSMTRVPEHDNRCAK